MNYYFSIFIHGLTKEKFRKIAETFDQYYGHIEYAEKDLIVGRSNNLDIIYCLLKLKEHFPEARFAFSQNVGLAKGLSKIAELGEILISEEIEQKVIDNFEIACLGMLSIEGMSSEILVCRLDKPTREIKISEPKPKWSYISKKGQIELLQNLLSVSNAVLVTGPTGSGKTIFFDQLTESWQDEKAIFRTNCPAYIRSLTFRPITEIVTQILGLLGAKEIEEKQKIVEARLKELGIADIGTSYLALLDFLGLTEEESILEKVELKVRVEIITDCIAETIKRISWTKPVAIIIEDVENMDTSSVNLTQRLMAKLADEKVCFIFSSYLSDINITGTQYFELREIGKKELSKLIEDETGESISLPPTTPFHVSQYLLLYNEEKHSYLFKQYLGETSIAKFALSFHDVKTIIKRRLELLGDKRDFLYNLAVAGNRINPDEFPVDKKDMHLFDSLVETSYLKKFSDYYIFINPILHDEIYDLAPNKKDMHLRLADYYSRIEGYQEQAAFHYRAGGNYKKSIDYLIEAARLAAKKGGYESGINYYNEALELCQREREAANLDALVALNEGLADIYRALGEEEKALKYYKVVLDSYKEILRE